jgi:peptidylprolyl isomerase
MQAEHGVVLAHARFRRVDLNQRERNTPSTLPPQRALYYGARLFLDIGRTRMTADLENMLYLDVPAGRVVIELRPDLAPNHVARIKELAREGFYDGIAFHRVIDGFMAQTGDPKGDGTGGSGQKLKAEFSNEPHVRGICSMARTSNPNSADSQFFIMLAASSGLDNQYTVWGKVASGMEHIDAVKKGDRIRNGSVTDPDRIVRMRVAADAEREAS